MIRVSQRPYGVRKDGKKVTEYILDNGRMSFSVMDHGAIILSINVPDRNGEMGNVALGFDCLGQYEEYLKHNFGSFVGRVANRISDHAFTLDGVKYNLDDNNNTCCLHGGFDRYNQKFYETEVGPDSVTFTRLSPDMEQGFPGNLGISVKYSLTEDNGLCISYKAVTDKATPVNFTNHCFFDLSAEKGGRADIRSQELWMENARHYMSVNSVLIPEGLEATEGTRYDFVSGYRNLGFDGGFDNAFIFDKEPGVCRVAVARDAESGRTMEVFTDQDSIQLYTGQNNNFPGRGGIHYGAYSGFCLETQGYINAVNDSRFPGCILRPGETYSHFVEYRFSSVQA